MGDHAEDEIFKEIHGHYPWQDPLDSDSHENDEEDEIETHY
jgi:hypothetical protein